MGWPEKREGEVGREGSGVEWSGVGWGGGVGCGVWGVGCGEGTNIRGKNGIRTTNGTSYHRIQPERPEQCVCMSTIHHMSECVYGLSKLSTESGGIKA